MTRVGIIKPTEVKKPQEETKPTEVKKPQAETKPKEPGKDVKKK